MATKAHKLISIPYRLEPFGQIGWTMAEFESSREAAAWFKANGAARMPCWVRFQVIDGELFDVR